VRCRFSLHCSSHLCRHPRVFIRRIARVLASQNLVGYESQKSAREIRNRFKVVKGSRQAFYSLCPRPESRFTALSPESEEPIMWNNRFFYSRSSSPETEEQSALSPARDRREPIGSLPDRQKEAACPQGLDPDFGGPFTRTSRARALRPKPEPEPGPARRGERARACVLHSSSHPHLQEHGSIQLFKLGSLHLH
jgi:hypothetical protein